MPALINLEGLRFGRLFVVDRDGTRGGAATWNCVCDCGTAAVVSGKRLRNGDTKSCGGLHVEHAMKHVRQKERPIGFARVKKQNGRVEIKTERGFVFEHVKVMEDYIGRGLRRGEVVHHIDGDISNNHLSNLALMSNAAHTRLHNLAGRRRPFTLNQSTENTHGERQ